MAQYSHHVNNYHRSQVAKRLKRISLLVTFIVLIGGTYVGIDLLLNKLSNSNTITSIATTTSVQSASISLYRTPYFQFQATNNWVALSSQSTEKKFVYVKKDSRDSITQQLTIVLDRPFSMTEADMSITNTIAVSVNEDGSLSNIGEPSTHCKDSWPQGTTRNPTRITHAEVSFVCSPDSFAYNLVVGTYGGNEIIEMNRPDGTTVKLTILLSDLTAYPSSGDLRSILSSFIAL